MKHIPNILMLLILGVFTTAMYLMFFEEPWLSYKNRPFPILHPTVRAGEVIPMRVIRCNSTARRRTYGFSHSLVRDDQPTVLPIQMPPAEVFIDSGCHDADSLANVIPVNTPPGRYHVIGLATIQMISGPYSVEFDSQSFEVVP